MKRGESKKDTIVQEISCMRVMVIHTSVVHRVVDVAVVVGSSHDRALGDGDRGEKLRVGATVAAKNTTREVTMNGHFTVHLAVGAWAADETLQTSRTATFLNAVVLRNAAARNEGEEVEDEQGGHIIPEQEATPTDTLPCAPALHWMLLRRFVLKSTRYSIANNMLEAVHARKAIDAAAAVAVAGKEACAPLGGLGKMTT